MSNKEKKLVKRDYYNALLKHLEANPDIKFINGISADQMKEFADHEIDLLAKKNASDKKPTKQQEKNKELAEAVLACMEGTNLYTITEMTKFPVSIENDLSASKLTSLMGGLLKENRVERIEEKRRAYFRRVAE